MTEVQVVYHHRNAGGQASDEARPIPFCCKCYTSIIHAKDISYVHKDLDIHLNGLRDETGEITIPMCNGDTLELAKMALSALEALQVTNPGFDITNPHLSCPLEQDTWEARRYKNQQSHTECYAHHLVGLTMMANHQDCVEGVAAKIEEQGLPGPVDVYVMSDFNPSIKTWKSAAKYLGNSVDLYTVKIFGKPGKDEKHPDAEQRIEFSEEPEDETIEHVIQEFFA